MWQFSHFRYCSSAQCAVFIFCVISSLVTRIITYQECQKGMKGGITEIVLNIDIFLPVVHTRKKWLHLKIAIRFGCLILDLS